MARLRIGENETLHFRVFVIFIFPPPFYIWDLLPIIFAGRFRNAPGISLFSRLRRSVREPFSCGLQRGAAHFLKNHLLLPQLGDLARAVTALLQDFIGMFALSRGVAANSGLHPGEG
jgi:hypothetical protein